MNLALYIVFAVIVVLSIWAGYKHGLILSVAHLAAIVASLYLAALLSGAFSNEIVSGMRPFAEGYLDHQVATAVMPQFDDLAGGENLSIADTLEQKPETAVQFCAATYRAAGIGDKPAMQMAREAQAYATEQHTTVSEGLVQIFCEKLAFVAGTALAFILILVLLLAVGNLPNLTFRLPEHEQIQAVEVLDPQRLLRRPEQALPDVGPGLQFRHLADLQGLEIHDAGPGTKNGVQGPGPQFFPQGLEGAALEGELRLGVLAGDLGPEGGERIAQIPAHAHAHPQLAGLL